MYNLVNFSRFLTIFQYDLSKRGLHIKIAVKSETYVVQAPHSGIRIKNIKTDETLDLSLKGFFRKFWKFLFI